MAVHRTTNPLFMIRGLAIGTTLPFSSDPPPIDPLPQGSYNQLGRNSLAQERGRTVVDIRVSCPCGNEMVMSEFAVGMRTTCPSCGHPLNVSWQNSRPLDSDEPTVAVPVSEVAAKSDASLFAQEQPAEKPRLGKNHCDRCGRPFRGEWDRHEANEGALCNICVNLVRQVDPNDASSGFVAPIDTLRIERDDEPVPAPVAPTEDQRSWFERNWPTEGTMQKIALYGGLAVVVLAALVFVTSGFDVPEMDTVGKVVADGSTETVPEPAGIAFYVISMITGYFGVYLGMYIFLSWGNRLPNETLIPNLIAVAPVALLASLLWLVPPVMWIVVLFRWMWVAILAFTVYGFEWGDIVRFPASFLVAGIFKFLLWYALMGLLGIFTT